MRRIAIKEFLHESKNGLLLDVRSPAEYTHAHIPGAVSLPLFSNEERAVVGTEYKQVSRQAAIKIGLDYFGPKMRKMVEEVERLAAKRWSLTEKGANNGQQTMEGAETAAYTTDEQEIPDGEERATSNDKPQTTTPKLFIYCWRGGMRSGAVSWLLNLYGFDVTLLAGGYKAFRNWVLPTIAHPYPLRIIGGFTGSGKTAILKALSQKGEPVINLEELASHKGSAFGNIGLPPQPSQEMFENNLALQFAVLAENKDQLTPGPIWMEDESQRIGHINLPQALWQHMRQSPLFFLDIPFEERLQNLVVEYGHLDREKMVAAIQRITKRLGGLEAKKAIQFLQEENIAECFRILLRYYDKQYQKGLYNRENLSALLTKISCETVTEQNAALVSQAQLVS